MQYHRSGHLPYCDKKITPLPSEKIEISIVLTSDGDLGSCVRPEPEDCLEPGELPSLRGFTS